VAIRYFAIYTVASIIFLTPLSLSQAQAQTPTQAQTGPVAAPPGARSGASSGAITPAARAASPQLPNLGDGSDMTPSDERRMGDRIAREIYRDPDYIDDPVVAEYVQGIWQPLLAAARLRGDLSPELDERFAWEIMMGKDRSVNAFALPGGYFGLHMGLVAVVTSRDELASVMGHELSHVTQRHIARIIAKQSAQTPWMIGALILGALAASKNPDAANALIVGGQAVAAQNQLNFSRDMEREADRVGFGVMTQAGFEPAAFVSMFEKLQQASRLNDNGAFPYLRSHPLTTERVADMQARVPQGGAGRPGAAGPSASPAKPDAAAGGSLVSRQTMEHAMVAARASVLSNPGVDALRAWAPLANGAAFANLDKARQAAALYGAALAAARLRDLPGAASLQSRLSDVARNDVRAARLARLLAVDLALAGDDARRAVALLDEKPGAAVSGVPVPGGAASGGAASGAIASGGPTPGGALPASPPRPEMILLAQALVRTGQASVAAQQLQTWVANQPRDAQAWQLLSGAYAAQGQGLRAIRADAEARFAHLDYAAALERFKAAQALARDIARDGGSKGTADHIEASIIDTRARQTALLLREQSVER
jgi:predicted Zn-dependent protease